MAYADAIRAARCTTNQVATLIEGIGSSTYPLTWSTWAPTYSANGAMTWTAVTTNKALYIQIGKLVLFIINATGTVGGVVSTELRFTLPVTAESAYYGGGTAVINVGSERSGHWGLNSTTQARVKLEAPANWTAGSCQIYFCGFYQSA